MLVGWRCRCTLINVNQQGLHVSFGGMQPFYGGAPRNSGSYANNSGTSLEFVAIIEFGFNKLVVGFSAQAGNFFLFVFICWPNYLVVTI